MGKIFVVAIFFAMLYVNAFAAGDFVPRTTAPDPSDPRFTTENPFYNVGLGMPNCTAYAWGRAYEILGEIPALNIGNARYWFYNDGGFPNPEDHFERGQTPRLGAIAVWGTSTLGPFGHVAVVEYIHPDGTVDLSESFWGGEFFAFSQNVDVHHGEAWRTAPVHRNFLGFIYLCAIADPYAGQDAATPPVPAGIYYEDKAYVNEGETNETGIDETDISETDISEVDIDTPSPGKPLETLPIFPTLTVPERSERTLRFVIGSTLYTDNDATHTLDAPPFIENDRAMVPLRIIGEALGATNLAFNQGMITFDIGILAFAMEVGKALPHDMGVPMIVAQRAFVPLGFVVGEMGVEALWDGYARAVYVFI